MVITIDCDVYIDGTRTVTFGSVGGRFVSHPLTAATEDRITKQYFAHNLRCEGHNDATDPLRTLSIRFIRRIK